MILLSGSSNRSLAQKIAEEMNVQLGQTELSAFTNGERRVYIKESVKGQDVALIQSFSEKPDAYIIEFALMTDALFRLGARRVFAVIPWFAYSLQDKVHRIGEPIASKVIASMLCSQSVYRFLLMNLHNPSISGFFSVPSSVLSSDELFAKEIEKIEGDVVLVSSDFGGLKRVGKLTDYIVRPIVNMNKVRNLETNKVEVRGLVGDVSNKVCVIVDDLISTGSTAVEAATVLRQHGAKKILLYATHALLAGNASDILQQSALDEVVVTDTVDVAAKAFPKLRVVTVAPLFAHELLDWCK